MDIKETRKEYLGLTDVSISDLSIIDYELTGILEKKGINNLRLLKKFTKIIVNDYSSLLFWYNSYIKKKW